MTGLLVVVGLGPGGPLHRTAEAVTALDRATDVVGYGPYVAQAGPRPDQQVHVSDNREEAARARFALDLAAEGRRVAVVSSGDAGIFAMATAVLEELDRGRLEDPTRWTGVEVDVVAGVTAASAAAARVGAPLGHDLCLLSLSDVLKPWEVVERRLDAVGAADLVVALYNPISRHRPWQLGRALELLARHRPPTTPVVVARNVGREDEAVAVVPLAEVDPAAVDMRTLLIVGSTTTRSFVDAAGRTRAYTPRTYP